MADSNRLSCLRDVDTQFSSTCSKAVSLVQVNRPEKPCLLPETCPIAGVVELRLERLEGCDDYVPLWASSFLDAPSHPLIVVTSPVVCERNETGEMGNRVEPFDDHGPSTTYELPSALNICQSGRCCYMGCV